MNLGYQVDFRALSIGLEGRWGQSETVGADPSILHIRQELGLRLNGQRYFDLSWMSAFLGLFVEGVRYDQRYEHTGVAPARVGYGMGFGGVVGADVPIVGGVSLQIRSGPISHVFRQALSETGGVTGDTLKTPLTWWSSAGLMVRL